MTKLALPIMAETADAATLYAIAPFTEGSRPGLAAFTDARLLKPPLTRRPALEAALTLFHAPRHDLFMFNAPHPQACLQVSALRATRLDLSLLAGFLTSGAKSGEDPAALGDREFSLGRLHGAHYLYTLAATKAPASRARFALGAVLVELGLLQEAYDGIKEDRDPEAFLTLAMIHRKTGDQRAAREMLAAIGPGTPLEDRKTAESAWLDLEAGRGEEAEKAFRRLAASAFDKAEALAGLGAALANKAFSTRDKGRLSEAAETLRAALVTPSPSGARVCFQLGNLYFRSGDPARAEACYRRSAALSPAIQTLANLALTLIKNGKTDEAAAVTLQVALTDMPSAARLAGEFPKDALAALFPPPPRPAPPRDPAPRAAAPDEAAPPAPAAPPPLKLETLMDVVSPPAAPTETESRNDDFISRAFRLASALEDELGKKVYFNLDGLADVERKLRLTFLRARTNPQAGIDLVKDCAAFLCYSLQERHKGRLIKLPDFDPWGWPMIFESSGVKLTSYPVHRAWRLLWEESVPEPGWLTRYFDWVAGRLKEPGALPSGLAAARGRIMSHPERLADVGAEHKRMLILNSSLAETSQIEIGRSGIIKLENAIKNSFKPDIPPTTDGWKLLRCYGHILAEIMIKDFKAAWYNADGDDGGWSLQLPWKTFIFPLGKVYKTAVGRGSLDEYYDALLADKLRALDGPRAG